MDSKRISRKTSKVLRNPKLLRRLQSFMGEQKFNRSTKRLLESDLSFTPSRKRTNNDNSNNCETGDFSAASYSKGLNKGFQFSDNSDNSSDGDVEILPSSNLANSSLRDIYMKHASSTPVSTTPIVSEPSSKKSNPNPAVMKSSRSQKCIPDSAQSVAKNTNAKKLSSLGRGSLKIPEANKTPQVTVKHSMIKLTDVGGLDDTLNEMRKLLLHLKHPNIYKKVGVKDPPIGFLLHGPPGCGKTLVARAIAGHLALPYIEVVATELICGVSGESENKIRELFEGAVSSAPCILFIDEIDAIAPKRETTQREMEKRIVTQLVKCLDDLKDATAQVIVIGATNRPDSLDAALRRAGRFDREICIGIPNETSRLQILKVICNELRLAPGFDLQWLARHTPGYVGADLIAIVREASIIAISRVFLTLGQEDGIPTESNLSITLSKLENTDVINDAELENLYVTIQDFQSALRVYVPSAKREGFAIIPDTTWNDVGALKVVRETLKTSILWPIKYREEFQRCHIMSLSGILLCGPKGCGKTLLAKAVANECSMNFLSVKGPELLSMYLGESERAVRECFQRARNSAPCVIFFDEVDALCPPRSASNENDAAKRVVNQLLTEIDGIEERKQVFVMGATNRPDNIDSAMLRPGRFEKTIYVGVPNEIERLDILKTITSNGTKPKLAECVSLENLSSDLRCEGLSGADLASLVREASFEAFRDYIKIRDGSCQEKKDFEVKQSHFEHALTIVRPSVNERDQMVFKSMNLC